MCDFTLEKSTQLAVHIVCNRLTVHVHLPLRASREYIIYGRASILLKDTRMNERQEIKIG